MTEFDVHPDSFVDWDQIGASRPYRPNYRLPGYPIDGFHEMLATCPMDGVKIDIGLYGWLRRADALKLYELAWFATGDVLELGTNRGLSAFVLASAIRNSGRPRQLVTMDISERFVETARKNLAARGIGTGVEFLVGDAAEHCDRLIAAGSRFGLAFVDHSHAYEAMVQTCIKLAELLEPGACVVFHDFNDRRNTPNAGVGESPTEYGVYNAVRQQLPAEDFDFVGVYGCCGVFRRR
jgi:predicted O-methyltransferase YrrM